MKASLTFFDLQEYYIGFFPVVNPSPLFFFLFFTAAFFRRLFGGEDPPPRPGLPAPQENARGFSRGRSVLRRLIPKE